MNSVKRLLGLLTLSLSALLLPATGFAQIYLEYGAIKGDGRQKGYEGLMEIDSFSWSLLRSVTPASSGQTRESTQPYALEVRLTKKVDGSSTDLAMELLTGTTGQKAVIRFVRTIADKTEEYLMLELCEALITSLATSDETGELVEILTLNLTAFKLTYSGFDESGGLNKSESVSWDFKVGKTGFPCAAV